MASLEQRNGIYRSVFRYAGRKFSQSLATDQEAVAGALKTSVEQRIKLIQTKMLPLPPYEFDISQFIVFGNAVPKTKQEPTVPKSLNFEALCKRFFDSFLRSSIEDGSFEMLNTHKRNLIRHIGKVEVSKVNRATAQSFINKRAKEPGIRECNVSAGNDPKRDHHTEVHSSLGGIRRIHRDRFRFKRLAIPKG